VSSVLFIDDDDQLRNHSRHPAGKGLFGYEKGTLTGAAHGRVGKIEQVSGVQFFWTKSANSPTPFKRP